MESHLGQGATVIEVHQATQLDCRVTEAELLRALKPWASRPSIRLPAGGDTECLRPAAPVGPVRGWLEPGVRSKDVTHLFR